MSHAHLTETSGPLQGTVIAAQANYYRVQLNHPQVPGQLLCLRRGRLKKQGQQVFVGDQVLIAEPDWGAMRAVIDAVLPRTSALTRPAIANVDQILLVFALQDPEPDPWQISRFLVTAEASGLEITVVLSKADLVKPEIHQAWITRLSSWGYRTTVVSVLGDGGIDSLLTHLKHQLSVICGPSGVGKSSLIQRLIPGQEIRIGAVSEHWHKGKHTTRHVELFRLPGGGLLADTPGFNQPDLPILASELGGCFPEIRGRLAHQACQFHNCQHLSEPDCAVRGAWERYEHYQIYHQELTARATISMPTATLSQKQTQRLSQLSRKAQRRHQHQGSQAIWLDDLDD